jgi:hypothetical protein
MARAHSHAQLLLGEDVRRDASAPRRAAKAEPALQVFRRLIPRAARTLFKSARDQLWRTVYATMHRFLAAAASAALPVRTWRLLLRPMHRRPYMDTFVPRRCEKAAGRDGGVERSVALDREHGRRVVGRREAAAMRTIVRALHLPLPSDVDASKLQYLFMP